MLPPVVKWGYLCKALIENLKHIYVYININERQTKSSSGNDVSGIKVKAFGGVDKKKSFRNR